MTNNDELDRVVAWFRARLPEEWTPGEAEITLDREEITVLLRIADPELGADDGPELVAEARSGRAAAFREDTRQRRMTIADQASRRFGRTVSWGAVVGQAADGDDSPHRELWTHVAAPVMTRLRVRRPSGPACWETSDPSAAGSRSRVPRRSSSSTRD